MKTPASKTKILLAAMIIGCQFSCKSIRPMGETSPPSAGIWWRNAAFTGLIALT